MLQSQLINLLCDRADDKYGGRLPVHVRLILDEFANIGQIPNFDKLIATIRSREISASIILQSQSQLKAIYKDAAKIILNLNNIKTKRAAPHKVLLLVRPGGFEPLAFRVGAERSIQLSYDRLYMKNAVTAYFNLVK